MLRRALILLVVGAGAGACGGDVVLGERPDPPLAMASGAYQMSFGDRQQTDCVGEYADRAGAFDQVDAATAGLIDGRIELTVDGPWLSVSGAPIDDGFQAPELLLTEGDGIVDAAEPGTLLATVPIERDGTGETRALVASLVLSTADAAPDQIHGWATICYAEEPAETASHACRLSFAVSLEACCQPDIDW